MAITAPPTRRLGTLDSKRVPFAMAPVAVILDYSEHMCCGEHREVRDLVNNHRRELQGEIHEERHWRT